jgi:hypothetical protein
MHYHFGLAVMHLLVALADHIRGGHGSGCMQANLAKYVGLSVSHQQSLPTPQCRTVAGVCIVLFHS